ncbi:unnamed protein product [marine sediment metagenome]|uniref:Uncharacterized protein n=1 Tax=marine sediment metagenome TaxID=412755 RepID=X0YZB0_9ZZZZ
MNFPLVSNIVIVKANNDNLPDIFNEVYHLEYFLQFSPDNNGYSTTKYAFDLEKYNESGESFVEVSVYYEDLDLTLLNDNYSYVISLSSREIQDPSNNNYNQYISGSHTDIFLNLSDFENSHKIRIDEAMTFSKYFDKYRDPSTIKSDITFNYVGTEEYNSDLLYNYTTYHYFAKHVLWSEGDL